MLINRKLLFDYHATFYAPMLINSADDFANADENFALFLLELLTDCQDKHGVTELIECLMHVHYALLEKDNNILSKYIKATCKLPLTSLNLILSRYAFEPLHPLSYYVEHSSAPDLFQLFRTMLYVTVAVFTGEQTTGNAELIGVSSSGAVLQQPSSKSTVYHMCQTLSRLRADATLVTNIAGSNWMDSLPVLSKKRLEKYGIVEVTQAVRLKELKASDNVTLDVSTCMLNENIIARVLFRRLCINEHTLRYMSPLDEDILSIRGSGVQNSVNEADNLAARSFLLLCCELSSSGQLFRSRKLIIPTNGFTLTPGPLNALNTDGILSIQVQEITQSEIPSILIQYTSEGVHYGYIVLPLDRKLGMAQLIREQDSLALMQVLVMYKVSAPISAWETAKEVMSDFTLGNPYKNYFNKSPYKPSELSSNLQTKSGRTYTYAESVHLAPMLRKLPDGWEVSEEAEQLASKLCIDLPEGYTIVTEHDRLFKKR